ncbi:GIY-YIG nuclease family protein [Daejeonella sp.]|uniref:GIY-YIG nuclease family protein n=1 Tax=Daejeonella sp. TaxID=2805397 RepID=UPI0039836228
MQEYFVYILTNKSNTVLYVGVTNSIKRRVLEHRQKQVYSFTSKYNCTKLVFYEMHTLVNAAIRREKQIKKWLRSWKNELVEKRNPDWVDLAADWFKLTHGSPLSRE